jgi:hypothetical protein
MFTRSAVTRPAALRPADGSFRRLVLAITHPGESSGTQTPRSCACGTVRAPHISTPGSSPPRAAPGHRRKRVTVPQVPQLHSDAPTGPGMRHTPSRPGSVTLGDSDNLTNPSISGYLPMPRPPALAGALRTPARSVTLCNQIGVCGAYGGGHRPRRQLPPAAAAGLRAPSYRVRTSVFMRATAPARRPRAAGCTAPAILVTGGDRTFVRQENHR